MVCERQTVFQSWKSIERCLSRRLDREVDLLPYKNNIAFFARKNYEDAKKIAKQRKIPLKGQPEVFLFEWTDALTNNMKKVVSYGARLDCSEGTPTPLVVKEFLQVIGDNCGGLIEVDKRTENLKLLYEARIRVRKNETDFLLELLKLREGEQCHIVRIQPLSPAIQPFNIRRKVQHFRLLCEKMSPE